MNRKLLFNKLCTLLLLFHEKERGIEDSALPIICILKDLITLPPNYLYIKRLNHNVTKATTDKKGNYSRSHGTKIRYKLI